MPCSDKYVRDLFGARLGQRRHQHALPDRDPLANLTQEMLHLAIAGHDLDLRVQQAGGTDHLLTTAPPVFCNSYGPGVALT